MRSLLVAAALSVSALSGCSKSSSTPAGEVDEKNLASMTVDEVEQAIATKKATPVDCNSDGTRKKKGVVPGAILISDDEAYAASELPADKSATLVFYCSNSG